MSDFLGDLSSLRWWMGVVVVGLLVNIAAPAVRAAIVRLGRRFFGAFRTASERFDRAYEERLATLRANPHLQVMAAFEELREAVGGMVWGFVGASLLAYGVYGDKQKFVALAMGVVGLLLGMRDYFHSVYLREVLKRAASGGGG